MQAATQLDRPGGQHELRFFIVQEPVASSPSTAASIVSDDTMDADAPPVCDNLPNQLGLYIGRRAELERGLAALEPEERGWGVIIAGLGGAGKTALAIELAGQARAARLFDAYVFVSASTSWQPLEGAREETLAHSSLDAFVRESLRVLGDHDPAVSPDPAARRQALLLSLSKRRTLLIWDNLESLVDEQRALVVEFLRRLPSTAKAIISSRSLLGASACELRLDRMNPDEVAALTQELVRRDPRLGAALDTANPETRRQLDSLVGGNPLALQMVLGLAAQAGCSLEIALSRVREPVRFRELYEPLLAGMLDALDEQQRALLAALAVARASSPEALADITGLPLEDVARGLEQLAARVLAEKPADGRYALHPLVRTYARVWLNPGEPLAQAGLDARQQRHALRYWVEFAARNQGADGDSDALAQLDLEWPNLEAAAFALRELSGLPGQLKDAYAARLLNDLAKALSAFFTQRGYADEQARLGEWAYEAACALEGWQSAGWRAYQVAWAYYGRADFERAMVWADRMAAAMERAGNRRDRAAAVRLQGLVAEQQGQLGAAERLFVEALATYRELRIPENQVAILCDLGSVAQRLRQLDRADGYYQHALELAEQFGSKEHQALCANNLGLLWLERSRPAQARGWFERGRNLAAAIGRDDLVAFSQSGMARVLEGEYRYREALDLAEQALEAQERVHSRDAEATRQLIARLRARAGNS